MQIMKIIEFHFKTTNIIEIIEFDKRNIENHDNRIIPVDNLANHERQFLLRNCKAIISFIKYTKKPIKLAP